MMIMMRAVVVAAAFALSVPTAAYAAEQPASAAVPQVLPMGAALSALPLAVEDRTGYQRTSFKHWNAGDIPADGCNMRAEWLPPSAEALCRYGAEWTATKLRWGLAVDEAERDRLYDIAAPAAAVRTWSSPRLRNGMQAAQGPSIPLSGLGALSVRVRGLPLAGPAGRRLRERDAYAGVGVVPSSHTPLMPRQRSWSVSSRTRGIWLMGPA
ncbi:hypothetical protein ACFYRL_35475 [Streptomyces goshikiensis]|uniref:hypothetical protein n=1 Tax=Streptomyces goshikiensis TaxID=1942 RepID=UPI0036C02472